MAARNDYTDSADHTGRSDSANSADSTERMDSLEWLRSCPCQRYECFHKIIGNELESLRYAGDRLLEIFLTRLEPLDEKERNAVELWEQARHGSPQRD